MPKGKLIVVDGMDFSGKDTQLDLLKEKLVGYPVIFTREPGGAELAELIRDRLMKVGKDFWPIEDFILFWASRVIHMRDTVIPALKNGHHVISNRYDSSTFIYQICGEERPELLELFLKIRSSMPEEYLPEGYIFLDMPPAVCFARSQEAAEERKTHFDIKPLEYYERVSKGLFAFPENVTSNVRFINAYRTREEVQDDLWNTVKEYLPLQGVAGRYRF